MLGLSLTTSRPVPRDKEDNFYNPEECGEWPHDVCQEIFPFPVFPPYPRGVVRVLSMDVVRLLAKASQEGRLRMIYGDDPCIGVHLRQLLLTDDLPSLTLDRALSTANQADKPRQQKEWQAHTFLLRSETKHTPAKCVIPQNYAIRR